MKENKLRFVYAGSHLYYGVVVFDVGSFCLKIIKAKSNCRDYDIGSAPELNNFDSIEIVGNIYDNPELIVVLEKIEEYIDYNENKLDYILE